MVVTRTAQHRERAIQAALQAARWAPSVHNTQPWSFGVHGEEISLRADTARKLLVGDSAGRELLISCGAALFTVRTALRCAGYEPSVRVLPDPDRPSLLATIRLGAEVEADEDTRALGGEIERRRTHRAGFTDLPVPERLVEGLVKDARCEGARLTPVGSVAAVGIIAALTQAAQAAQSQDRVLSLEVIRWARPPGSARKDGVPAEGYPRRAARTDPDFPQRDYAWRHDWGSQADQCASTTTEVVALLTTPGDTRQEWIATGQALQSVLLHASAYGVSAAFHTQALEMYHLREFLRQELCSQEYPQMIMRLGITFDDKESVRRPLSDMLE
ncbi:Acg family FMN-binding oxidoreductase [Nonomuraea aurantiaca]|uniref:Acg family FMN-binding oxidoreductase n=1 Tax=Nonomuraea aurantiaca TaxID=2878562 RepID=UPI001CDA50B0|nr:nitroreductase family protein [Nonomuraea aurantiaca]MCA2229915.1 nitroreductase family protein [Nonomuraea aurantiaca]